MSDQVKRLMFFFNSINILRLPGKKTRRKKVTNCFTSDQICYRLFFLPMKFYANFFFPIRHTISKKFKTYQMAPLRNR